MRKCASGGQSLANAERGVGMRGLTRLRPHWDQGRVLHFGLETGGPKFSSWREIKFE